MDSTDPPDETKTMRRRPRQPQGTTVVGYLGRQARDLAGRSRTVLRFDLTGVEVVWDGQRFRSLPRDWRQAVAANDAAFPAKPK